MLPTMVAVVMAGGGGRTLWGAALLRALGDAVGPVRERAGVSAGAAMALAAATGRFDAAYAVFVQRAAENARNVYPLAPLRGARAFPQEPIYRELLRAALAEGGFERLRHAEPVRIGLAYVQPGFRPLPAAMRAWSTYRRRKRVGEIHGPPLPPAGLGWRVVTANLAPTPEVVIEQVIASSATPPVTGAPRLGGRVHLDGGLVDNVPVRALSPAARAGPVLVLLSRPYPHGGVHEDGDRLYLAPTAPVPIKTWDYTSPDRARRTYEEGLRAGEALRRRILDWRGV